MTYTKRYMSPIGVILLAADDAGLTGLWFEGSKYFAAELPKAHIEQDIPVLLETTQWLDVYFAGKEPDFTPPLHLIGSDFRQAVWNILLSIPYGRTMTYGQIAKQLAEILIVSDVEIEKNDGETVFEVAKAEGGKCERCWRYSKYVGENHEHPTLCQRCAIAIEA